MANTIRTTTSNGAQVLFSVDFALGFISRGHIYVYTGSDEDYATQLTYTWVSDSQIQLDAPQNLGVDVKVRRVVPRDIPVNDYEDGAILHERNLDASFAQALMINEELDDGFMVDDADVWALRNTLNMLGHTITNLAEGVLPTDAVTLAQVQELLAQNVIEGPAGDTGGQGPAGDNGLDGATGADGAQGSDGKTVTLTTSTQAFKYDEGGFNPVPSSAVVTANALNTTGLVFYEFFVDDVLVQASSVESAFLYIPPADVLAQPDKVEVQIRENAATGPIVARDQLTLFGVQKGTDAVTVILSNEAHAMPSGSNGVIEYAGSGTDIQVYIGATPAYYDDVFPYDRHSFRVAKAVGTNVTLGADTTVSTYTRRFADASNSTNRVMAGVFTIIAVDGGLQQTSHVRVQSLNVNADGLDGVDAVSGSPLQTQSWFSGDNGATFVPAETTFDHYADFFQSGLLTAQHQVRATLDPVAGTVSMASVGQTGDATTIAFAGQNTTLATATVTHTESGVSLVLRSEVLILGEFADQTIFDSEVARLEAQQDSLVEMVGNMVVSTAAFFVQPTAPVAGVAGVPNPIPDFARWYNDADGNRPHYWNGSSWVDLSSDIGVANAAAILALETNLATIDGNVAIQGSAISVLETTAIATDAVIASLSSDIVSLESSVIDAENDIISNASATSALDTRTTQAEDDILIQASDISDLSTEVRGVFAIQLESGDALQLENGEDLLMEGSDSTALIIGDVTNALSSRITVEEGNIDVIQADVTILKATVDLNNGAVVANSSAVASLDSRVTVTEDGITTNASEITTLEAGLTIVANDLATEITTSANALSTLDTRVAATEGKVVTNATAITDLGVALTNEVAVSANARQALDTRIIDNEGELATTAIAVTDLRTDLTNLAGDVVANSGATTSLGTIVAQQGQNISTNATALTNLSSSLGATNNNVAANAAATSGLSTRVALAEGELITRADDITVLQTTVGGNTATLTQHSSSINGLEAEYGVAIDAQGNVAGFKLVGGATSTFSVLANQFKIQDPSAPAGAPVIPFAVSGGVVYMSDVVINGNLLVNGSVGADEIGDGEVNTPALAPNSATAVEAGSRASYTTSGTSYSTVITVPWTSTGADTLAMMSFMFTGLGNNGTFNVGYRLRYGLSTVIYDSGLLNYANAGRYNGSAFFKFTATAGIQDMVLEAYSTDGGSTFTKINVAVMEYKR
jgi:hypothetical protein